MSILTRVLCCVIGLAPPAAAQTRPAPLAPLPVTRLDDGRAAALFDQPRSLSVTFARPIAVRDVLLLLFRGTAFSVVLDRGVAGTFAGELKDVTLRQALESVLEPAGLDYNVDGTIVRVFPRRAQTRIFSVDHLHTTRAGLDFFAELGPGIQTLLSASGKHHVNRKASLVQVTDFADRLDAVANYLETANLRANRQVRIQARVFEVSRTDASPIEWSAVAANPRSGVRRSPEGAGWRVENVDAWLRTVGEIGAIRHIAAPVILAMNNEPAILRAEDPSGPMELQLTVTAHVSADRIIHMHVAPAYAEKGAPGGQAAGQFSASLDTVMRLADGDTTLIGGFLRQKDAASHAELVILLSAKTVVPTVPLAGGSR